jgi:SAM-dependent methyltransferase
MLYAMKVRLLKTRPGKVYWHCRRRLRGELDGRYKHLPDLIRRYAPGRSFVDVGCMWAVNGEYAFIAEESGAVAVKGVDLMDATPEFQSKKRARNSKIDFIRGDASHPATIKRIGVTDVVLCAGVLYHHPSPFDVLAALRQICGQTLILRTSTIPEIQGVPNAAVYFPMLKPRDRKLWDFGVNRQVGITDAFDPAAGYGNWLWGLTPSCLQSLVETAGFRVEARASEAFSQTLICSPVEASFTRALGIEAELSSKAEAATAVDLPAPARELA